MEFKFKSVQVIGVEGFDIKPSYYFHVHQALGSLSIFFLLLIMFTSILSIVSCAVPRKTTTGGERERDRERRSERDREGRTRREGGRERGGAHREPIHSFFCNALVCWSSAQQRREQDSRRVLFACGLGCRTPRLPRGLASGRNARRENPQHHGRLGPALQDLLVSRRAVCASHGRLVERERRASPSLSSHPLFASNFLPPLCSSVVLLLRDGMVLARDRSRVNVLQS